MDIQSHSPVPLAGEDQGPRNPRVSKDPTQVLCRSRSAEVKEANEEEQQHKSEALARVLMQLQPLQSRRQRLQHAAQHASSLEAGSSGSASTSATMPLHRKDFHTTHTVRSSPGTKPASPPQSPTRHRHSAAGVLASTVLLNSSARTTVLPLDMPRSTHWSGSISTHSSTLGSVGAALPPARSGRRYLPPASSPSQQPSAQEATQSRPPCSQGKRYPKLLCTLPEHPVAQESQQVDAKQLQVGPFSSSSSSNMSCQPGALSDITDWLQNSSCRSPQPKQQTIVYAAATASPQAVGVPASFMELVQPSAGITAVRCQPVGQALGSMLLNEELGLHHLLPTAVLGNDQPAHDGPAITLDAVHAEKPLYNDLPQQLPPSPLLTTWQDTQHDPLAVVIGHNAEMDGKHVGEKQPSGTSKPCHSATWPSWPAQPRQLDFAYAGSEAAAAAGVAVGHHIAVDGWQACMQGANASAVMQHKQPHFRRDAGPVAAAARLPPAVAIQQQCDSPVHAWIAPSILPAEAQPQLQGLHATQSVPVSGWCASQPYDAADCRLVTGDGSCTDISSAQQGCYAGAPAGDQLWPDDTEHRLGCGYMQSGTDVPQPAQPHAAQALQGIQGLWGRVEPESPGAEEFEGRAALLTYMLAKALQVRGRRTQRAVLRTWRTWAHAIALERQVMEGVARLHHERVLKGVLHAWRAWASTRLSSGRTSHSSTSTGQDAGKVSRTISSHGSSTSSRHVCGTISTQADSAIQATGNQPSRRRTCNQPSQVAVASMTPSSDQAITSGTGRQQRQQRQGAAAPRLSASSLSSCTLTNAGALGNITAVTAAMQQATAPAPQGYDEAGLQAHGSTQELVLQALAEPSDASLQYDQESTAAALQVGDTCQYALLPHEQHCQAICEDEGSPTAKPDECTKELADSTQHFHELHRMLKDMEALLVAVSPCKTATKQPAAVPAAVLPPAANVQHVTPVNLVRAGSSDARNHNDGNTTCLDFSSSTYVAQYKQHQSQQCVTSNQCGSTLTALPPASVLIMPGQDAEPGAEAAQPHAVTHTHHVPTSSQMLELPSTASNPALPATWSGSFSKRPAPGCGSSALPNTHQTQTHPIPTLMSTQQWPYAAWQQQQRSSTAELQEQLMYMQQRMAELERQVNVTEEIVAPPGQAARAPTTEQFPGPAVTAAPKHKAASVGAQRKRLVRSHSTSHSLRSSVPTAAAVVSTKHHCPAKLGSTVQTAQGVHSSKLPWLWAMRHDTMQQAQAGLLATAPDMPTHLASSMQPDAANSLVAEDSEEQLRQQLEDLDQALQKRKSAVHR